MAILAAAGVVEAQRYFREGSFAARWAPAQMPDSSFVICRVAYRSVRMEYSGIGWQTDYPYAEINLTTRLSELTKTRVSRDDSKPRLPTSDQLHLVERIRLVADGEILEDEMTITDPKAYTEPLVIKHYWQRRPDIEVLEYVCNERPRDSGDVIQTKEGGP